MPRLRFYSELPVTPRSLDDLLHHREEFTELPDDWWVVVTDIKGSTKVHLEHRTRDLNKVSVRSLMIVLNIAREHRVQLPYVYGGDGASIVVPDELKDEVMDALVQYRHFVTKQDGLDLRVGAMQLQELRQHGHELAVAKTELYHHYNEAVFTDSGLQYAEEVIKSSERYQHPPGGVVHPEFDFSGVEVSWQLLYEPDSTEYALALIIAAENKEYHLPVYAKVLDLVREYLGAFDERHPFVVNARKQRLSTDALKLDGLMKMIVVGSRAQIKHLVAELEKLEKEGVLKFGHLVTDSAVITSIVEEREGVQLALVDIADGGYIEAATDLKQKLE